MASSTTSPPKGILPLLFGRFLIKTSWTTEAQVERALALQDELTPRMDLSTVLHGVLTVEALSHVLAYQRQTGALFVEAVQTDRKFKSTFRAPSRACPPPESPSAPRRGHALPTALAASPARRHSPAGAPRRQAASGAAWPGQAPQNRRGEGHQR